MKSTGAPGIAFLVIGIVFIAIGSSGRSAFVAVGAAFVAIGVVMMVRQRRASGLK